VGGSVGCSQASIINLLGLKYVGRSFYCGDSAKANFPNLRYVGGNK